MAAGDEASYRQLFNMYAGRLHALALKMTKSPEHAKDLVQDIFVKLWVQRRSLTHILNFEAFLFTVARNLVTDHLRKKVFVPENDAYMIQYLDPAVDSPEQIFERRQRQQVVNNAIKRLPPQLQKAFSLRYQGYSHEEIAKEMGISKATSKSYIVRSLDMLKKYLSAYPEIQILLLVLLAGK